MSFCPVLTKERKRPVLVAFSVALLGGGEDAGEAVRVVRDSGLPNRADAMFTTGGWSF